MTALSELRTLLGAELRHGDAQFERVVIDSRAVQPGDVFVALRGERHDGHAFVAQARAAGAVGAVVADWVDVELPQLRVGDTLEALQLMGAAARAQFRQPVVAVTGSNGKTTTKQMLAAVFSARGPVLATQGNLNNHIGVPLTLLRLRDEHRTAVIEMGANHPGEIALLTRMARPDVGVVTQAGDAHLEGFGSREGVARAKGELFAGLDGGIAVINADDAYADLWRSLAARASMIHFGTTAHADVRADQIEFEPHADAVGSRFVLRTPMGSAPVHLPLPGRHNVMNALAAAACGVALGLDAPTIAAGLARVEGASGRLSWLRTAQGARVLDDSYNANPTSLRAAMELLASLPGRRWLVLGGMAELGPEAARLHRDAGAFAKSLRIDGLYALGPLAAEAAQGFGAGAQVFDDAEALSTALAAVLTADAVVLIKGSRSARMERVVTALTGQEPGGAH
ncbi:UDP-N-acetylmuramoyl-tripeptide--D-alanyl-D-alanine ligase [Fontimonas sp. SYSU GA230001]|uniref:UDP-N-acetylmuramoyl-tripeptide--D-alanyl-D- alanine ligase n=1 Tax=Fontimonas sp. SYSU GA230001 TaxID=3142450 RepID=UPI0032B6075E